MHKTTQQYVDLIGDGWWGWGDGGMRGWRERGEI